VTAVKMDKVFRWSMYPAVSRVKEMVPLGCIFTRRGMGSDVGKETCGRYGMFVCI
jgi:hypothetical protein